MKTRNPHAKVVIVALTILVTGRAPLCEGQESFSSIAEKSRKQTKEKTFYSYETLRPMFILPKELEELIQSIEHGKIVGIDAVVIAGGISHEYMGIQLEVENTGGDEATRHIRLLLTKQFGEPLSAATISRFDGNLRILLAGDEDKIRSAIVE